MTESQVLNDNYTNYHKTKKRHGNNNTVLDANQIRQVAGCLPIDLENRRVLLVSSRKHENSWVLPKGGWENDETQQHAAQRETWEEAGVRGTVTHLIGVFEERNKKRVKAHHWIFEMNIKTIKKKYPEQKKRGRRWFTFEEALVVTQPYPYIQQAILKSSLSLPPSPTLTIEDRIPKRKPSIINSLKAIFI